MDDHFWPSLYPGIFIAVMIGFATGGIVAIFTGALGGLIGSIAAYFLTVWFGLTDSAVSLAILIAGASVGGYGGAKIGAKLLALRRAA